MKKAFTLIELLLVVGIMGLLGTMSVGGYRAMQRGMEERGVMQSVNSFMRTAYQRAQIDRQPVAVFFWNETVRAASDTENEIVAGHAVAVRRYGRFSAVRQNTLIDEFADLNLAYQTQADEEGASSSGSSEAAMFIYPMELSAVQGGGSSLPRTLVEGKVYDMTESIEFFLKNADEALEGEDGDENPSYNSLKVPSYGFRIVDRGGVNWKAGMAYGMEFIHLELPRNYIFGSRYSASVENPISGATTRVFDAAAGTGNGRITGGSIGDPTIEVSSLRPDGAGGLRAKTVAVSDNPESSLN